MKPFQLVWNFFREQIKWAAWFYGILVILTIGMTIAVNYWGFSDNLDARNTTSTIFILVIGLLYSYWFLDHYFKLGVSRKKFFKAALPATAMLSVVLALLTTIITALFETIVPKLGFAVPWTDLLTENGFLFIIQSFVDSSFYHFVYLLIGWFMGIGFYRFRWRFGLLFIILSFPFIGITEFLQNKAGVAHTMKFFTSNPQIISMGPYLIFFIMIAILIVCNYRLTKDTPIRL